MFTIEQIKAAHAQVKSGADFPKYVQDLVSLGVNGYETRVSNVQVHYSGENGYSVLSSPGSELLDVSPVSDAARFKACLKAHQAGNTNFPTFRKECAETGVEKWIVDTIKRTCTYYDRAGQVVLEEQIPLP